MCVEKAFALRPHTSPGKTAIAPQRYQPNKALQHLTALALLLMPVLPTLTAKQAHCLLTFRLHQETSALL